jgi:hypothetical protein
MAKSPTAPITTNPAIKFVRTTDGGQQVVGRAVLLPSGEVQLTDMSDEFRARLVEDGVFGVAKDGIVYPKDGTKFMRGCLFAFKGSYLRAVIDNPTEATTA